MELEIIIQNKLDIERQTLHNQRLDVCVCVCLCVSVCVVQASRRVTVRGKVWIFKKKGD